MGEESNIRPPFKVAEWVGDERRGCLRLLDQTRLPGHVEYVDCRDTMQVWDAIRRLVVRGAPAIGVAASYGMVVAGQFIPDGADFLTGLEAAAIYLEGSRPTAVNLSWAVRRVLGRARNTTGGEDRIRAAMLAEARAIQAEDEGIDQGQNHLRHRVATVAARVVQVLG